MGLAAALQDADFVLTGEGRADEQTLAGKAALGVARYARGIPVALLCGGLGRGAEILEASGAFAVVQPIIDRPIDLDSAMADTEHLGERRRQGGPHHRNRPAPRRPSLSMAGKATAKAAKAAAKRRRLSAQRRVRRARIGPILDRLAERYGWPTWSGPRLDPVAELVLTILAQNTADTNSHRAFVALQAAYPGWDAVLAAPNR